MRYLIHHRTSYSYASGATLGTQIVRLYPRSDFRQHLLEFHAEVDPKPTGRALLLDAENNTVLQLWFLGETPKLELVIQARVEVFNANPFGFLPDTAAFEPGCVPPPLLHYVKRAGGSTGDPVAAWAQSLYQPGAPVLQFLTHLNQTMSQTLRQVHREEGPARPAHDTLRRGEGACRDTTVLFMDACRSIGLPARFVSGYTPALNREAGDLHAWPEVWIPGGGWRGFDPARGCAVADEHIAVCASAHPHDSAPVSGSLFGPSAISQPTTSLRVEIES